MLTSAINTYDPVIVGHVDKLNPLTSGMIVDIPLINYPQIGGQLQLGFKLHYQPGDGCCEAGFWTIVEEGNLSAVLQGAAGLGVWYNYAPTNPDWPIAITDPDGGTHSLAFDGSGYDSIDLTRLRFVPNTFYTTESQQFQSQSSGIPELSGTITGDDGSTVLLSSVAYCSRVANTGNADINCESPQRKDRNGNSITFSRTGGWTDTVGRQIPVPASASVSVCPAGPSPVVAAFQWNFPGYNGGTYPVTICYSSIGINIGGTQQVYPTWGSQIQTVVLPGSTIWNFTYNPRYTPALGCPNYTGGDGPIGELSGITYPTGATTSFTWWTGCSNSYVLSKTENANDGTGPHTWNYQAYPCSAGCAGPTVASNGDTFYTTYITSTDPMLNDTVITTFTGVLETSTGSYQPTSPRNTRVDYYQGTGSSRVLLKSKAYTYISTGYYYAPYGSTQTGIAPTCGSHCQGDPSFALNLVLQSEQTILPGGLLSEVDYTYDNPPICLYYYTGSSCTAFTYGRIMTKQEYDFGQGAKGALLRSTSYTYQDQVNTSYRSAHILDRVQNESVQNGSGVTIATTTNLFDENNGSPQGTLGNMTSSKKWVNTSNTTLTSQTIYNANGMPVQQIDPKLDSTYIGYDATGVFVKQITYPQTGSVVHADSYTHDATTGLITSHTDQNNQLFKYDYADPLFRRTSVKSASGTTAETWTTYSYPTLTQVNVAQDQSVKSDGLTKTTMITNGFGKLVQSQVTSDPSGTVYNNIVYDADERQYTVSNPYRSKTEPTYGLKTTSYDALGRMTSQIDSDSVNSQSWTYTANSVVYKDENKNQWTRIYDALGRLTKVIEPGSLNTTYQYDALGNLKCVDQWGVNTAGVACSSGLNRSFVYDSLSRLTSASNPETGTILYSYLTSGALCAGDVALPCSKTDARNITTTYSYDALNRVLSKTYPAGTASSCYEYDSSSLSLSGGNFVGRLTNTWTQVGTCPAASSPPSFSSNSSILSRRSILGYDAMGRVLSQQQCTKSNCNTGTSYAPAYTYDLAGDVITHSSGIVSGPFALTFTNGYDGAEHLCSVLNGATTLFTTPQYVSGSGCTSTNATPPGYSSAGGLMNAVYGTGLQLYRTYDNRLRIASETDGGNAVSHPTPGTATLTISGADQTY